MKELAWAFVLLPFVIIGSSFIYGGGVFREGLDGTSGQVKSVTAEQLGVSVDDIKDSSSFVEDLGADSLVFVRLIVAIEEKFNITIPDEKANELKTVNDVVNYVETNKPPPPPPKPQVTGRRR
jgi:acyl carrier protein